MNRPVWKMYSLEEGLVVTKLFEGCLVFYIPVSVFFGVLLDRMGMLLVRPMGLPWSLWLCQLRTHLSLSLVMCGHGPILSMSRKGNDLVFNDTLHWSVFNWTNVYEPWDYSYFRGLGCKNRYRWVLYGSWFSHLITLIGPLARYDSWKLSAPRFWLTLDRISSFNLVGFSMPYQSLINNTMAPTASGRRNTSKGSRGLRK